MIITLVSTVDITNEELRHVAECGCYVNCTTCAGVGNKLTIGALPQIRQRLGLPQPKISPLEAARKGRGKAKRD